MRWVLRRRRRAVLVVLGLCGVLCFYGLTVGDLYRTENLRAIIAADFLRSGDWLVPRLYGEPLFTKPPGMYAAIALVSWPLGGVTTWTARLPSALAATATVFLVYWYFGRHLGRLGGLVAACVVPASLMWLDKVPTAEIDMLQTAWVTAAVLFLFRALDDDLRVAPAPLCERPLNGGWWLAALLCVAGGFLTKWTAPAFFYGTAVPLLWWRGRLRLLLGRAHVLSAALAAAICLGWAGLAAMRTGWDVFYETVSREALQRLSPEHHLQALQELSADHQPKLYPWQAVMAHPFRVLAAHLPWSVFAPLTLWPGFARLWDERRRRLLAALHCWTWPNLLFWSVIPEHAMRHSFPLFPGISGLAAMVWLAWLTGRLRWPVPRVRAGPVFVGMVAAWLVAKVIFIEAWVPRRNTGRAPRAKGEEIAAIVPADQTLYVFQLKDEGIMFYYGRQRPATRPGPPVVRLPRPEDLPSHSEPVYCILDKDEAEQWKAAEVLLRLEDEQGAPIALVRMAPAGRSIVGMRPGGSVP
jgi:4-amino-4-deoxy-L-arabinose transferase-like glycosyltransferase